MNAAPMAGPVLQRYRSYSRSAGESMGGYKIVKGVHLTFGDYHLKYHRIGRLDVFNEMHVKFDSLKQQIAETSNFPYFYFNDDGELLKGRSSSGRDHLPDAESFAKEVVDAFLKTSPVVSHEEYERAKKSSEDAEAEIEANTKWTDLWAVQKAANAAAALEVEQEQLETAKKSADEAVHMAKFVKDTKSLPLAGFKACVEKASNAGSYGWLHKKAEWYREKQTGGWTLTAAEQPRLAKGKTPDVAAIRLAQGWPAEADVTFARKASGTKYSAFTITADLKNYTLWAMTPAGEAELKTLLAG